MAGEKKGDFQLLPGKNFIAYLKKNFYTVFPPPPPYKTVMFRMGVLLIISLEYFVFYKYLVSILYFLTNRTVINSSAPA